MTMNAVDLANFDFSSMPRVWARTRNGTTFKCVKMYHSWTGNEINVSVEPQMGGGESEDRTERENNIIMAHIKKGWLPYPPANPKPPTNSLSKEQMKNKAEREEFEEIMESVKNIRAKRARMEEEQRTGKKQSTGGANVK